MIQNWIILILCLTLIQCSQTKTQSYFEGKVTYTIKYQSSDNLIYTTYGDTLTVYLKDGFIKKVYNSSQTDGLREELYNPNNGKMYMKIGNSDTISWYDLQQNSKLELINISITEPDIKLLNNKCKLLSVTTKYIDGDFEMITNDKYYFSDTLRFNPKWFEKYNFGFFSTISKKMNSYFLKYESITEATKMDIEVVKIEPIVLDKKIFEINRNAPLKYFKY